MGKQTRDKLGALAAGQHGLVTFDQIIELGLQPTYTRTKLRTGEWRRVGHRLYAANGSPDDVMQAIAAAVMSRPAAFLSGRTAAWLHGFSGVARPSRPEITVPYSASPRSPLATVRRSQHHATIGTVKLNGLPAANRPETIFRMSAYVGDWLLARLVDDELLASADAAPELGEIYLRHQGERMRGMATLRPILLERLDDDYVPTESELEAMADRVLADLDLPIRSQVPLPWAPSAGRVDRLIEPWKLIIELDGRRWHARTEAFDADRRRDNTAQVHGYATLRFTWRMLREEPFRCRQLVLDLGKSRG